MPTTSEMGSNHSVPSSKILNKYNTNNQMQQQYQGPIEKKTLKQLASIPVNENVMEAVAILDMSGSMGSLTQDTIGGFNAYVQELKKNKSDVKLTLIVFDDYSENVWVHRDIKECDNIDGKIYHPRGSTALTDAIGIAITTLVDDIVKQNSKPGMVSFFITTDGQENSSHSYSQPDVKQMITKLQDEEKWTFVFAGSNIDAFSTGQGYGIQAQNIANIANDAQGQKMVYQAVAMQQNNMYNFNNKAKRAMMNKAELMECEEMQQCNFQKVYDMQM